MLNIENKKVRAVKSLIIGGKTYRTAHPAAVQWAIGVRVRMWNRGWRQYIGPQGYIDQRNPEYLAWINSSLFVNCEKTAYRRSLPIFKNYFQTN